MEVPCGECATEHVVRDDAVQPRVVRIEQDQWDARTLKATDLRVAEGERHDDDRVRASRSGQALELFVTLLAKFDVVQGHVVSTRGEDADQTAQPLDAGRMRHERHDRGDSRRASGRTDSVRPDWADSQGP